MKHKIGTKDSLFYILLTWYITLVAISVTRDHEAFLSALTATGT